MKRVLLAFLSGLFGLAQISCLDAQSSVNDATLDEQIDEARLFLLGRKVDLSGAKQTASGMWIVDVAEGKGAVPKKTDKVEVHYTGWLTNGTQFDSSKTRKKPFQFSLRGGVIKGWIEGVATMKPGGKRYLVIPPKLAYGPKGRSKIPGNSVLIFEIDYLRTLPPPAPPKPVADQLKEAQKFLADRKVDLSHAQEAAKDFWIVDVVEGEGPTPAADANVTVHYTGWLTDGTQFDSSKKRDKPFTFNLRGGVIKGWLEGVKTMKPGGKRYLVIPPDMAYGPTGRPGIPGSAVLIFEIDYLKQ